MDKEHVRESFLKYQSIRKISYIDACVFIQSYLPSIGKQVVLKSISHSDIIKTKVWKDKEGKPKAWNWADSYKRFKKLSNRLELAIYFGDHLCGLMYGKMSDAKDRTQRICKINYIQAAHPNNPLKGLVLEISEIYANTYAGLCGALGVAIQDPLPGAIELYHNLGYTENDPFDPANSCLFKPETVDKIKQKGNYQ